MNGWSFPPAAEPSGPGRDGQTAPATGQAVTLCRLADLEDPGSRSFLSGVGADEIRFFVVRQGMRVFAYLNHCPHTGASLDWLPGRMLSADGRRIQCALHLAQFRLNDGFCERGPCAGQTLTAVAVSVRDGRVLLTDPRLLSRTLVR